MAIWAVIMAGGSGTRFWPLSRQMRPKQFLNIGTERPLIVETINRLKSLIDVNRCTVVAGQIHVEQLKACLPGFSDDRFIVEPCPRNTAPCIGLAAVHIARHDPNAALVVLPADHHITDVTTYQNLVSRACELAEKGHIVTLGIKPNRPETGYGYIKRGEALAADVFVLEQFVEKPDQPTAEGYIASGDYVWNSGMFMFTAAQFLASFAEFQPEMAQVCERAMEQAECDMDFIRPDAEVFATCPSDSIDYAVMELTPEGTVVSFDCDWSDIGAWSALWEAGDKDFAGNVTQGDVVLNKTQNSYVRSQSRLVTTTRVSDLVVVETADAVMVADRHSVQDVKDIVHSLKRADRSEADVHQRVFRPWGSYESLTSGDGFQVKRLIVNPGQQLSLQLHQHRAEHWVVVHGTAEVVNGDSELILSADQSTYIPLGVKHRLSNPGP